MKNIVIPENQISHQNSIAEVGPDKPPKVRIYLDENKTLIRLADDLTVNDKMLESINECLPEKHKILNKANYSLQKFNPKNGIEIRSNPEENIENLQQLSEKAHYLNSKKKRLYVIHHTVKTLFDLLVARINDVNKDNPAKNTENAKVYEKFRNKLEANLDEVEEQIDSISSSDNSEVLEKSQQLINKYTYSANKMLEGILSHPAINHFDISDTPVKKREKTAALLGSAETFFNTINNGYETIVTVNKKSGNKEGFSIRVSSRSGGVHSDALQKYKNKLTQQSGAYTCLLNNLLDTLNDSAPDQGANAAQNSTKKLRIPSTAIVPGIRNGWRSWVLFTDKDGNKEKSYEMKRSSHIAVRAGKKQGVSKDIRQQIAYENLKKLLFSAAREQIAGLKPTEKDINLNFVYTSLLSTINPPDYMLNEDKIYAINRLRNERLRVRIKDQESKYKESKYKEYHVKLDLFNINHAVNSGRYILPTYKGSVAKECKRLYDTASKDNRPKDRFVSLLLQEYHRLLNMSFLEIMATGSRNRELALAVIGQLISEQLGYGRLFTCASGKDRAEICDQMIKSYQEYFYLYGEIPKFDEIDKLGSPLQKRKQFLEVAAANFTSGHGMALADANACSIAGLKTPYRYLPSDLQKAIITRAGDPNYLKHSESLAKAIDAPKKCTKMTLIPNSTAPQSKKQASAGQSEKPVAKDSMPSSCRSSYFAFPKASFDTSPGNTGINNLMPSVFSAVSCP